MTNIDKPPLDDLIAKLESATGGSRELDRKINNAIGERIGVEEMRHRDFMGYSNVIPHYTTSLDAALTLVPDGWVVGHMGEDAVGMPHALGGIGWTVELYNGIEDEDKQGQSKTAPLAVCIAALKARKDLP